MRRTTTLRPFLLRKLFIEVLVGSEEGVSEDNLVRDWCVDAT
jgi:hypothetical protein